MADQPTTFFSFDSELPPQLFNEISQLVYAKSGITLKDGKEALVASRLGKRLRALKLPSYAAYLAYLKESGGEEEMIRLLDAISTNVTHFYREPRHFEVLREKLESWKSGQRRFRLWCAASSTGEEPYTLAMTMAEALGMTGIDWRILATDISTRVLAIAQAGRYEEEKLKEVPPALRQKYFDVIQDPVEGKMFQAKPALREKVHFSRLNLSQPPFPMRGPLDFVFCRNVMIYFDNQVRKPLIDEIYRLLKPGGYLCVGSSESLTGIQTALKSVAPSVYVKS